MHKAHYETADKTTLEDHFVYDGMGNILQRTRQGSISQQPKTTTYTDDAIGQLLSCKEGQRTESYEYDRLGNRMTRKVNEIVETAYEYNGSNQLMAKTEQGIPYTYAYDKRGNLTEERRGEKLWRQYSYDATNRMRHGRDSESGEKTEYNYNGLAMRVQTIQTQRNHAGISQKRECSYIADYLSEADHELLVTETGFGSTRMTYGAGYERLSQKVTKQVGAPESIRSTIAADTVGKTYLQSDYLGSPLLLSNQNGEVLRYAERGAWGELKLPVYENLNYAGVENSLCYTNYNYDPMIEKYFAKARFYDVKKGRMLAKDPVKRGVNGYPYCKNNPINNVDPTGEIANVLVAGGLGVLGGGIVNFAGSIISQKLNGETVNLRKAAGAAANGAITWGLRASIASSGVGLITSFVGNLGGGILGSIVEQLISKENVSSGKELNTQKMVTDGFSNAIGSIGYGKLPFKNLKTAFWKDQLSKVNRKMKNNF